MDTETDRGWDLRQAVSCQSHEQMNGHRHTERLATDRRHTMMDTQTKIKDRAKVGQTDRQIMDSLYSGMLYRFRCCCFVSHLKKFKYCFSIISSTTEVFCSLNINHMFSFFSLLWELLGSLALMQRKLTKNWKKKPQSFAGRLLYFRI